MNRTHEAIDSVKQLHTDPVSPFPELQIALKTQNPLLETKLFRNDHVEVDACLRKLLNAAKSSGTTLAGFELEPDEDFKMGNKQTWRLDVNTLLNILDEAKGKFA